MNTGKNAPVPFWFWNGDQQENEITRQLDFAKDGGWRGLAVHARTGNKTPYVEKRWLELFRHTCIEAKKRNLEIWLYDEEGFPSGTVGGRLPARGEEFQEKYLVWHETAPEEAEKIPNIIASFRKSDTEMLVFERKLGEAFTDMLSQKAADAFLEMTHEKYTEYAGEFFGNTVTTVYTDDIGYHCGCWNDQHTLPWSDTFAQEFEQINGYSILKNLSALVWDLPDSAKIRRDYRSTLSLILNKVFVRSMRKWANNHGMILTGHLCGDEGPFSFMVKHFGDPSFFYMEEDIPGIDDYLTANDTNRYMTHPRNDYGRLVNKVRGFPLSVLAKQASSVASQFKNGKCSSEVLTSRGWGVPVESQMAQMFFELALGVNIIVHHACSYTTEGLTKRDHPASYFFQQPYFCCNKSIYEPLNRSLALLQEGRIDADTLVIHPVNAVFAEDNGKREEEPEWEHFQQLTLDLLRAHVSFDYGYENLIAGYGKVKDKTLQIGDCCYKSVFLTIPMNRLSEPVQNILHSFAESGGNLTDKISDLHDCSADFSVSPVHPEIAVAKRITGNLPDFYLVNFSSEPQKITLSEPFAVFEPVSGKLLKNSSAFTIPPLKSCHLLSPSDRRTADIETMDAERSIFRNTGYSYTALSDWKIRREQSNVLVIDSGVNNGNSFYFDYQPELDPEQPVICKFRTKGGAKPDFLYAEKSNLKDLTLNGHPVTEECGIPHPATQALTGYHISDFVQDGENIITFRVRTNRAEYLYLTGEFSVQGGSADDFVIAPVHELAFGDLSRQGLPFYWGGVVYETETDTPALVLSIPEACGAVKAEVNGQEAGVLCGAPWDFDLTDLIRPEKNHIKLTCYNTALNFFGYHRMAPLMWHFTAWHPEGTEKLNDEDVVFSGFGIERTPGLRKD